ncbi:hypothetical protein [Aeromonas veronii]|uniref:hypothetical protein n=1 Tax=Aeromonas veronii TaxID=654 RepID=UPI003BA0E6EE
MIKSTCLLCKKHRELKKSHIIPKLIYRYIRRRQEEKSNSPKLLQLNKKKKIFECNEKQWQESILCNECEQLLSKNETDFARILYKIHQNMATHKQGDYCYASNLLIQAELNLFFNEQKANSLRYFAASYILRNLYLIDNSLPQIQKHELENFILGRTKHSFHVIVKVNTGKPFNLFTSTYTLDHFDDFKHYSFIVPNIFFTVIFCLGGKKLSTPDLIIIEEDLYDDPIVNKLIRIS